MIVKKRIIKANNDICKHDEEISQVCEDTQDKVTIVGEGEDNSCCNDQCLDNKSRACESIMKAIKCLSKLAKTDQIAKDSIANLAVVLFDLK